MFWHLFMSCRTKLLLHMLFSIVLEAAHGETLIVEQAAPRDYHAFLEPLDVKLYNCFKPSKDSSVPHSFTYKRRSDMTSRETGQLTGADRSGHDRDVFAICKSRMSDPAEESFKPVLVLYFSNIEKVGSYTDIPLLPRKEVSADRAKKLQKLAALLEGAPYNNVQGAASLNKLATCQDWQDEKTDFSFFMQDPVVVPAALPTHGSEHFTHLPKICRPMLAKHK